MVQGYWYKSHLDKLTNEAIERFQRLMDAMKPHSTTSRNGKEAVVVHGSNIRIAVDDFKTILAEIRKLK